MCAENFPDHASGRGFLCSCFLPGFRYCIGTPRSAVSQLAEADFYFIITNSCQHETIH